MADYTVTLRVRKGTDPDGHAFYGVVPDTETLSVTEQNATIEFVIEDDTGEEGTQPWTWIPASPYGFLMYSNVVGSSGAYEFGSSLSSDYKTLTITDINDLEGNFTYICTVVRQRSQNGAWPFGEMDAAATDPIVVNSGPPS